jgi:D-cysteine desulfhydrase
MAIALDAFATTLPPRVSLGALPSPLEVHDPLARQLGLRELLVKRDDLSGARFGGNKLRALEWLLPSLGRSVLTIGGYGSTWCAALSVVAAESGRRAFPALVPQPWTETVEGTLATTSRHGAVFLARSQLGLPLALARAWLAARRHGAPTWLPAGGATPLAVLGSVNAALEFVRQVEALGREPPDAVVVPVGSCGTAAGLLVGFGLAGWRLTVCGVRVADPMFANARRVRRLAHGAERLLRRHGLRAAVPLPPLTFVTDQLGRGYGHATPAARAMQATLGDVGLRLDLTYGAKCCAAIVSLAASFPRLCFWHTFDARIMSVPAAGDPLLARARATAEALWPHPKST